MKADRQDLFPVGASDKHLVVRQENGAWEYDRLIEWAQNQEKDLEQLYQTSTLQKEPDRKFLDNLCVSIVEDFLRRNG